MKTKLLPIAAAVLALTLVPRAGAVTTLTYQEGAPDPVTALTYTSAEDVMMLTNGGGYFFSSTDNFGQRGDMAVGNTGGSAEHIRRTLVRFNVTTLLGQYASVSDITSATLRLYVTGPPAGSGTINLFRLADANAGWVEGAGTSATGYGPEDAGGSTWAFRVQAAYPSEFSGTPWAGGGGTGSASGAAGVAGTDYISTALSSVGYTSATSGFVDYAISPSLIHTWVTGTNAGMLLRQTSEASVPGGNIINYHASQSTSASLRPQLIVTLVPEPSRAVLSLLGLGALCFRRRRSR